MSKIVPKLNLNKTPQLVDNNSLVMAKNIRLLEDGTIGPDTSLELIETNIGDATEHTIEHPAVVETVTEFFYSILDYKGVLKILNNDSPDLSTDCFNFGTDDPSDKWDDKYQYSNLPVYKAVSADEYASICCYEYKTGTIVWTNDKFKYIINDNILRNNNSQLFVIAIRTEIITNVPTPVDGRPSFFYTMVPKTLLNTNIVFKGVDYKVCNPVYRTKYTHDETIQPAWTEHWTTYDTIKYIAQIVGLDNKIYFFKESNYIKDSSAARAAIKHQADPTIEGDHDEYPNAHFVDESYSGPDPVEFDVDSEGYVTMNGIRFQDSSVAERLFPNRNDRIKIFEYDEVNKTFKIVKCAWKYNGGKINGCVSVNGTGEYILTICEYNVEEGNLVPIKHININQCSEDDDESVYTQAPNIPITNLLLHGKYTQQIPAGVYQFFIRYEIRENFYTSWFPCSTELSTAVKTKTNTIQGSLLHIDANSDSYESFILKVNHLYPEFTNNYTRFQIGFILSHDGGIFARSWKSFPIENSNDTLIYFDYNKENIEEINIDDLLSVNYDIFNVENVASFKNKLYIANYIETNFNEDNDYLVNFAQNIKINLDTKVIEGETYYSLNGYRIQSEEIGGVSYYTTYSDSTGTYNLGDTYAEEEWCSKETSYTYDSYSFTYLIKEWEDVPEYGPTPIDHDIPNSIKHVHDKLCLYSLYVYDSNNNRIDLITDNSSSATQDATPLDIITFYNPGGIFPIPACTKFVIKKVKNDTGVTSAIGIGTDNKYYIQYVSGGVTKYIKVNKIYYKVGWLERLDDTPEHSGTYANIYANFKRHIYNAELDIESLFNIQHNSDIGVKDSQTLLPFTHYDFYCHFVKQNGIITNGYKVNSLYIKHWGKIPERQGWTIKNGPTKNDVMLGDALSFSVTYESSVPPTPGQTPERETITVSSVQLPNNYVVYPKFVATKELPSDYAGYFITMHKHKNDVSEIVSNTTNPIALDNDYEYRFDCIEIDAQLYKVYDRLIIKDWKGTEISNNGSYIASGDTSNTNINKFGDTGIVCFKTTSQLENLNNLWIIGNEYNTDSYKELIKVTPFIKRGTTGYTILENQFLQGYFCLVSKLKHKPDDDRLYISDDDVYEITINSLNNQNGIILKLNNDIQRIDYSNEYNIHSNYNLNYLSLRQDITSRIRTYNVEETKTSKTENNVTTETNTSKSSHQLISCVDSLIASYIFKLDETYKTYTRKLFYIKEDNKQTQFNNTLRVSNVDVDEMYRYIYRFEATDYYNVPSHRGIITNLISIANTLYVHCEHSLFKFTDNKTINAQEEEVTLQENDIFNSGISEVFDAQYGYAGLKNREQSLITYNAYVFYDAVAKIIYAFGGEQQIGNISEPIKKLIKTIDPTDVQFVGDELHNRFFVNLKNEEGNVCLSFNFGSKSFIAIHDITFKFGFHSRRHTYFVHDNMYNGDKIGWSIYRIADTIDGNFIAYQNCYEPSLIQIADCDNVLLNAVKSVNACVDIIINTEYEKIKQLDYISWICSEIIEYGNDENLVAEEVLNRKYPGTKLRIYSDSTQSDLFELLKQNGNAKISNEERNVNAYDEPSPNPNSWQYPQYNCGVWSMNYFRDVLNTGDIFNYKASKNKITGGSGHSETTDLTPKVQRENLTQENSLIYGKYFVLRFIFNNKNFKLENVMLKMNDYGKTK